MTLERCRVGIVGPGWWASTMYVPALADHPDATIVAACGRDRDRTAAFAAYHDIEHRFTDPDEMFASEAIDAVIIATVNHTHHRLALSALDHGLHVLCEKPLALDAAEADDMAAAARGSGRSCTVPFTYRWMPTSRFVKRLVDSDYLGTPYLLNLRYTTGYARDGSYGWRFDRDLAGAGVLADIGSHWIDMARWLFGEIDAVSCRLTHLVERDPRPDGQPYDVADDGATIIVDFANGARGVITVSAVCHETPPFEQRHAFDLFGSDGTICALNDWDRTQEVRAGRHGGPIELMPIPDDIWQGVRRERVADTYRDVFRTTEAMTRGWASDIVAGRRHDGPSFDDGAAAQRVVDACRRSADRGGACEPVNSSTKTERCS